MSPAALPRVSMRKWSVGMRESVSCFMSSWCRNGKRLFSNDKTPASNVSGRTERKTAQWRMSPVVSTRVMLTKAPGGKFISVRKSSPNFCWSNAFNWLTRLEARGDCLRFELALHQLLFDEDQGIAFGDTREARELQAALQVQADLADVLLVLLQLLKLN